MPRQLLPGTGMWREATEWSPLSALRYPEMWDPSDP